MESNYNKTKAYWNKVFIEEKEYSPFDKLPYPELEDSIKWLCNGSDSILDFGCGSGRVLSRCLYYKVSNIYGIDIADKAINLAKNIMENNKFQGRSEFKSGSFNLLQGLGSQKFDGVIIFNILDNLKPNDGKLLIKEINRLLKANGKVILKLNPYFPADELDFNGNLENLSDNFYKESTGLFFWNISEQKLKEILKPYFEIIDSLEVEFKEFNISNRLYYLYKI
ncbi:MAG: class I SAM-dependent methyltransferase [bacterium]